MNRLLLILIIGLFSCKNEIEYKWLIPNYNKDLTQKKLLKNGFKRIPVDVPFYERNIDNKHSFSFQFSDFQNDILLNQMWEVKGDFSTISKVKNYFDKHQIRVSNLCNDTESFYVQHYKYNFIYNVNIENDTLMSVWYDFVQHPRCR